MHIPAYTMADTRLIKGNIDLSWRHPLVNKYKVLKYIYALVYYHLEDHYAATQMMYLLPQPTINAATRVLSWFHHSMLLQRYSPVPA